MRVSFEAFFRSRKRLPVFGAAGTKVGVFLLYVQLLLILQVGFAYVLPSGSYETCLDVSTSVSEEQFACLVQETNVTQVIIRAWHSSGSMDENAKGTVNAASSLVRNVDVYMFPCPTCGDYQGQVETMLQGLEGAPYQKVWLDIEGQQFWYDDVQRNLQIFEELADALASRIGLDRVGVYTSAHSWNLLMGDLYTPYSTVLPVWYPHYDNTPNFTDWNFAPYWPWTKVEIKQYLPDLKVCNADVDVSARFKYAS